MNDERRLSFGSVAELYDEVRPSYPAKMFNDIIELAPGRHALEVGAGTGKATVLFAERGVHVHAVEPSPQMAAVARRTLAAYGVTIDVVDFEDWELRGKTFPLVYAAQAWHWIDPETGYAKAREALEPGGVLAAFWNRADWEGHPLRSEIDAVYRRTVPDRTGEDPMHPGTLSFPDMWEEWQTGVDSEAGLERAEVRRYRWSIAYAASDYVALLCTHSPNIVLPDEQRDELLTGIRHVLEDHGGRLALHCVTWLYLARAI